MQAELRKLARPETAEFAARFFKTGPGQYGEGDQFLGLKVPEQRAVARKFKDLSLAECEKLLQSPVHEDRLTSLLILVGQFKRGDQKAHQQIYEIYLANTDWVNNWDLVDSSAGYIVGSYLEHRDRSVLERLARSDSLWERRVAIIATFYFIMQGDSEWTFKIATILLRDQEDLIHKAVGWMLREVGKRCSRQVEEEFLRAHYKQMPRTMLRYSIEHFSPTERQAYLAGTV